MKNKLKLIALLCILAVIGLNAQNTKPDDFIRSLGNVTEKQKIDLINDEANKLKESEAEESANLAIKAILLSDKIDYQAGKAKALKTLGVTEAVQSNYSKALEYFNQAYLIYVKLSNEVEQGSVLNNIGLVNMYQKDYKNAIIKLTWAMDIANNHQNNFGIANANYNLGSLYEELNDYPKALEYSLNSLKFYNQIKDQNGIIKANNLIGNIYYYNNRLDQALSYYQLVLSIIDTNKLKSSYCDALNNIANIYREKNNYNKALVYYYHILKISENNNILTKNILANINLGLIFSEMGNCKKSFFFYNKAREMSLNMDDSINANEIDIYIAKNYIKTENYSKAEKLLLNSLKVFKNNKMVDLEKNCSKLLSSLYLKTKEYRNASIFSDNYSRITEEISERNSKQIIESTVAKYNAYLELDRNKTSFRIQEKNLQIIIGILTSIIFMIIGCTITFLIIKKYKRNNIELSKTISFQNDFYEKVTNEIKGLLFPIVIEIYQKEKDNKNSELVKFFNNFSKYFNNLILKHQINISN